MSSAFSLSNVKYGGKARQTVGVFRVTETGIAWKNKTGKSVTVLKDELENIEWIVTGKGRGQLRVYPTEGTPLVFDGIAPQDLETLRQTTKTLFGKDVPKVSFSTKGWNWGRITFSEGLMKFGVDENRAFEVPLSTVEQASHDKNDVIIDFQQDTSTSVEGSETLVEMRLWVPNTEEPGATSSAEKILKKISSKVDVLSAKGTGIVIFSQVSVKTPRGRYDLEIFPNFMRMKGTQSSTISYETITRLTYLKSADEKDFILIISLDPPLRRGHTSHPHILMQFPSQATLEANLTLTDEQQEKYKGKLDPVMTGNKFEIILQVLKTVTGIKTTKVGKFQTKSEGKCVRCSLKAHDGYLYPMAKCFIFIYNPITLVTFDSISHVEFARLGASTQSNRTFDLVIFCPNGQNFIFNSIDKDEFEHLKKYLISRNVTIKGAVELEEQSSNLDKQLALLGDEESDDDDFGSGNDDSEDELDYEEGDAVPTNNGELGDEIASLEAENASAGISGNLTKRKRNPSGNSPTSSPSDTQKKKKPKLQ